MFQKAMLNIIKMLNLAIEYTLNTTLQKSNFIAAITLYGISAVDLIKDEAAFGIELIFVSFCHRCTDEDWSDIFKL